MSQLASCSGAPYRGVRARLLALSCVLLLCQCASPGKPPLLLQHGQFARLRLYEPQPPAGRLLLLLSGDGGWGRGLDEIAQRLAAQGTLVAGIDVRDWLGTLEEVPTACASPGASLAELGHYLQERYAVRSAPLLVGHSAGATLAYIALAEGRAGDFGGAVTLSFCADLDLSVPLCPAPALAWAARATGVRLRPAGPVGAPWIALHGLEDRECPAGEDRAFVQGVPGAQFVPLPEEGHAYEDMQRWWGPFSAALRGLLAPGYPARAR
ncbi:MAG TPA: AcvB/VirJ family lysyl-phosphatidylglycerol hydrolase [Steroidobacteraceae bacterium]|nr:AcvB/VirJ family lysyl-phosphatidylglycerol hydrolase [Steroidobacteraceae bacterium]